MPLAIAVLRHERTLHFRSNKDHNHAEPKCDIATTITSDGFKKDSIRTERWRFTRCANGAEELYDHEADSYEWTNLAGSSEYRETVAAMRERLPKDHAPVLKKEPLRRGCTGKEILPGIP